MGWLWLGFVKRCSYHSAAINSSLSLKKKRNKNLGGKSSGIKLRTL